MKSHTKHNLWQGTSPPWHPIFFPAIKPSSSAQIREGRAPSSTMVNHLLFLEGLRGSSGLTLQHRFHPLGAAGAGRADGELLQRHSRDSAGAGKSQQRSSQAGRCSTTHCSSFWRVANVQARGKSCWEARCSKTGLVQPQQLWKYFISRKPAPLPR